MDNLKNAIQISHKADEYSKNKKHQQAVNCYIQTIRLLQIASKEATSINSKQALNAKISQFYVKINNEIDRTHINFYQHKQEEEDNHLFQGNLLKVQEMKQQKPNSLSKQKVQTKQVSKNKSFNGSLDKKKAIKPTTNKTNNTNKHHQPNKNNLKEKQKNFRVAGNYKPPTTKKPQIKKKKIQIDPAVEQLIIRNIDVSFQDIVGMKQVKQIFQQAVIRPRKRPDLYTGIRSPPRGLLLFGPPGNGKTYICKALAKESGCTFFALSASSIMNKWLGQSQKMVRKVFEAAAKMAPSIIFIDEIDSMLTARSQKEHQASRRLKTEFLVWMDGISSAKSGAILVIGATNLPKQLDQAAKRRFNRLVYIGLPEPEARRQIVVMSLKGVEYSMTQSDLQMLEKRLEGFSASQIRNIVAEVAMEPIKQIESAKFSKIKCDEIRKINLKDFVNIIKNRKPIVSQQDLAKYQQK